MTAWHSGLSFDSPLLILDCEMTGPDPRVHQLIEIGALLVGQSGEILDSFNSLIGPAGSMGTVRDSANKAAWRKVFATLPVQQFALAPEEESVLRRFEEWLPQDYILVGYNLYLDILFLENKLRLGVKRMDLQSLEELFYLLTGAYGSKRSLACFSQALGIRTPCVHRALQDCYLINEALHALLARLPLALRGRTI